MSRQRPRDRTPLALALAVLAFLFLLAGCDAVRTRPGVYGLETAGQTAARVPTAASVMEPVGPPQAPEYVLKSSEIPTDLPGIKRYTPPAPATREAVEAFTDLEEGIYRMGPGDEFAFLVRGRDDISVQSVTVAPDGMVSLPRIGLVKIQGMTLVDATEYMRKVLRKYYENPEVTLLIRNYRNNRVYLLGQVSQPGVVNLPGSATLLEAIAMAGGVIKDQAGNSPPVNRAIIGRGKDKVIWIDLRELIENGNMALNARLKNGDVVFIPQGQNVVAYIMGQVRQPGPVLLRSPMTLLEALTRAGGLTLDGDPAHIYLVRPEGDTSVVHEIDLNAWIEGGDMRKNFVLREGDLIYVAERGISRFQYYLTRMLPSLTVIDFATAQGGK